MKNKIIHICMVLFSTLFFSQVGINADTPHPKSVLEIVSKNKNTGVLFTRLTTAQIFAIAPINGDSVVDGLWVYNTDDKCYWYWATDPRNEWLKLCGIPAIAPVVGLATINCGGSTTSETVTSGNAISGVTVTVPYTSGNGGSYSGQNINSTGVTGLTATLAAGNFNTGNGDLVFTLSGTPSSSGNASFAVNMGGSNCTFTVVVADNAGLADIDCYATSVAGSVIQGVPLSNVTVYVQYTNGNGGSYDEVAYSSADDPGLTLYLPAGNFNNGDGELEFQLEGTPENNGWVNFAIEIGGTSCEVIVGVEAGSATIDCASSVVEGTVTQGESASGVTVQVPYTGGDGGTYDSQSINSTGVTGLTANITSGNFANGSGVLEFEITGTASSSGTASFPLEMNGSSCVFTVTVDPATPPIIYTPICDATYPQLVGDIPVANKPLPANHRIRVRIQAGGTVGSTYIISTNTVNGVSYSATGTITGSAQNIDLVGSGQYTTSGTKTFTITYNNSAASTCNINVSVADISPANSIFYDIYGSSVYRFLSTNFLNFLNSSYNFGTLKNQSPTTNNSVVLTNGTAFTYEENTASSYTNILAKNFNNYKIIAVSYAPGYTGSTQQNDIRTKLMNYINAGQGSVFLLTEDEDDSIYPVFRGIINTLAGTSLSASDFDGAVADSGANGFFAVNNSSNDAFLKGPFGTLPSTAKFIDHASTGTGLKWSAVPAAQRANFQVLAASNLDANGMPTNTSIVYAFKLTNHKVFWFSDGAIFYNGSTGQTGTEGPACLNNSTQYRPVVCGSGTVYAPNSGNAVLAANIVTWAFKN